MPASAANAFEQLTHPRLRALLEAEGFTKPTAAQQAALPVILEGKHTLLIAPTGMGKTESALLPLFDMLLRWRDRADAREIRDKFHLIYVTPLRALNRDLMTRLDAWADALGLEIGVRHGDTSQSERNRQSRRPPDVLITTPETLQAMLQGYRLRAGLEGVKWVVIDEVHELAADERGAQLAVALERLESLGEGGGFQRVGLSATVGDEEEVARYLGGLRPVETVKVPVAKQLDLRVISPEPTDRDMGTAQRIMSREDAAAYLNACLDLIRDYEQTLLFVNTRETAEVLAARIRILRNALRNLDIPEIGVHHGSLSKDVRVGAEDQFKRGLLKGLICTSSMELGIDIGAANLVIQYSSPRQVTRLVQRVGRAGHRHDLVSNGVVLTQDADDIAEAAVIVRRTLDEQLETFKAPQNALDVLANQLAGLALERGEVDVHEAYELVRNAHNFRDLPWEDFDDTLNQVADQRLVWREGNRFGAKRQGRLYFYDNLSMIPDSRTFRIMDIVTGKNVATLDESFVAAYCEPGATFICRGEPWRVAEMDAEGGEVRVEPISDPLGAIPSWTGEEIPVPFEVAQGVGRLRAELREHLEAGSESAAADHLVSAYHTDEDAAHRLLEQLKEQDGFVTPTDTTLTLEHQPGVLVLNACFGTRVNETLGRLLASLLTARLGASVGLQTDAYRIVLNTPGRVRPDDVEQTLREIDPEHVPSLMEYLLQQSHYLKYRMVHAARKFGALRKNVDYTRVNVNRLLDVYKGSPLYREALRETLQEKLDLPRTQEVLRDLKEGRRELHHQELSPIGRAGLDQRIELIAPSRADATLLKALKQRLLDERILMGCLTCRDWVSETRVKRGAKTRKCPNCGTLLIGITRPWNRDGRNALTKKDRLTADERKELQKLHTTANLYLDHGEKALLALAARGVGPDAAGRILHKQREDELAFLRDIMENEITYARTRQFWD